MLYLNIQIIITALRFILNRYKTHRILVFYVLIIFLFLFSALRYEVGCDWSGYQNQWIIAGNSDNLLTFLTTEWLWWGLISLLQYLNFSYISINVASSIIFFMGTYILARHQYDPLGFLILLFPILIINMPMSGIRQGAAIGVICIAFVSFTQSKLRSYIFWVIVASGLHISAIAFLSLAPFVKKTSKIYRVFSVSVLVAILTLALLMASTIDIVSQRYLSSGSSDAKGAIFRTGLLALSGAYFLIFLKKRWNSCYPSELPLITIGCIGMIGLFFLAVFSSVIGDRMSYYFIPLQSIIFARIPMLHLRNQRELHFLFPYTLILVTFLVWTQTSPHFMACYVPYQTWLVR